MRLEALVFDAYGTLYDVHSVVRRCEALFPGKGAELSRLWRAKQLEYTWLRSLMGRYAPFSTVTREALAHACESMGLALGPAPTAALMAEYNRLAAYSEVPKAFAGFRGVKKAILSNGSPDMLAPLVSSNCWDALGAKSFGFTVFWVNRAGAPLDRLGFEPDRVVAGLDEILL
jgi:2-haloacid dehalogenase